MCRTPMSAPDFADAAFVDTVTLMQLPCGVCGSA
jgi:hypothetical protein